MKHILPPFFLFLITLLFFGQFLFRGLFPIPSDTIIGLYHPFRDLYAKEYPRGIPFKNFLTTDPVRQQYPWRELAISIEKKFQLPLWNPYAFAGTPLLANFQSASFYPLNILFFIIPFNYAWSVLVLLQPVLAGLFLYIYLRNLGIKQIGSFLGAIVFSFSGFSISWLEWNTIPQTALWIPLILLSIDKVFSYSITSEVAEWTPPRWMVWSFIFLFSITSSFFAGHLQTFSYVFIITTLYFLVRWFQLGKSKRIFILFTIYYLLFTIFTAIQWIPTLQFILLSARDIDQANWQQPGWFIPWQHLIQFIAPDFFGNPTTLNYGGVWNYGEFVGYVGILPLIFAILALFFRHDKKTLFFGTIFFLSLLFSLPTFIAKLPYILNIPFLSTTQPTRLLVLTDFALAVLAALGFDYFLKSRGKKIIYPLIFIGSIITILWVFIFEGSKIIKGLSVTDVLVSKQNLYLPAALFSVSTVLILTLLKLSSKSQFTIMIRIIIVGLVVFDLFRFGWKFTPFTKKEYLFPGTKTTEFLQKNIGTYRLMTTDSRILPPNFSLIYRLQSIDGYDPLYLKRYAEFIAASERGKPDVSPPFGFNRIITPHNYDSKIIDLLGAKYILSLSEIKSPKLKKVFQEGQTIVYENQNVLPRAFFVERINEIIGEDRKKTIETLYKDDFNIRKRAVVEGFSNTEVIKIVDLPYPIGKTEIVEYSENKVIVKTENNGYGFLVLADTYYPTWHATIDGQETKIYRTDYHFRGVFVPKGTHTIEFSVYML